MCSLIMAYYYCLRCKVVPLYREASISLSILSYDLFIGVLLDFHSRKNLRTVLLGLKVISLPYN